MTMWLLSRAWSASGSGSPRASLPRGIPCTASTRLGPTSLGLLSVIPHSISSEDRFSKRELAKTALHHSGSGCHSHDLSEGSILFDIANGDCLQNGPRWPQQEGHASCHSWKGDLWKRWVEQGMRGWGRLKGIWDPEGQEASPKLVWTQSGGK